MRLSAGLDDLDLRLITALQIAPRAEWERIGHALNVSASAAARRWERLTESGTAWQSCYPLRGPGGALTIAFIEMDCVAGRLHPILAEVAEDPHVFNISHVTGSYGILITAAFDDQASLARYVGFRLGYLDGVTTTRTHLVTAMHAEGSRWRLDRLDDRRRAMLAPAAAPTRPPARMDLDPVDLSLINELGADCRLPASGLAERTGLSPTSVRRRLARLDADHSLAFRCEVARFASGWPVAVNLWAAVRPDRVPAAAAALLGMRETRLCVSLSGQYNLLISMWLRTLDDLRGFESELTRRIPELVIADRSVALWRVKIGGTITDPDGRRIRCVPVSRWPEQTVATAERETVRRLRAGGVAGRRESPEM